MNRLRRLFRRPDDPPPRRAGCCCPGEGGGGPPPPGIDVSCRDTPVPERLTFLISKPGNAWDGSTGTLVYQGPVGGVNPYHLWYGANNDDPCGTAAGAPGIQIQLHCNNSGPLTGWSAFEQRNSAGICAPDMGEQAPDVESAHPLYLEWTNRLLMAGGIFCPGVPPGCSDGETLTLTIFE